MKRDKSNKHLMETGEPTCMLLLGDDLQVQNFQAQPPQSQFIKFRWTAKFVRKSSKHNHLVVINVEANKRDANLP